MKNKIASFINRKVVLLVILVYAFIAVITYFKLVFSFFQQDEWAILGYHRYWDKASLSWIDRLFRYELYTHVIPFSNFFSYLESRYFGINFIPYALFSIFLHILNSFMVYLLAEKLIKKKTVAFLAGMLFLVNSTTQQAVTWTATTMGTAGATFFALLSLIFFINYLSSYHKKILLFLSFLFFFIALGFKETSLALFLMIPILWFVYDEKKSFKTGCLLFLPYVLLGIFYFGFRFFLSIINAHPQLSAELSQPSYTTYLFRMFTLPLKTLAQSLIPIDIVLNLANGIILLGYPDFVQNKNPNPYIAQSIGADLVTYFFSIIILLSFFFMYYFFLKKKKPLFSKAILSTLFCAILSTFPLILIPGSAGYFSLFDGRHLYLTSIFTSILIAISAYFLYSLLQKRYYMRVVVVFLVGFLVILHILRVRNDINQLVGTAFIRKSILNNIFSLHPTLPQKTIFYIESDTAYYGLSPEEKIVPFQSGFGQTLLVWYSYHGENYPACFLKGEYLYEIMSEGYMECGGRGFGYFRKMESLKKTLKENNISHNTVISLRYNSSKQLLSPLTISK